MIQTETSANILTVTFSGHIEDADYQNTLIPALDSLIEEHGTARMLVILDESFEGYSLKAALDDAQMGLKHWRGFDRVAVASDNRAITMAVKAMSVFMPCPVTTFPLADKDAAARWLRESLGSIHQIDHGEGVVQVQLLGKVDAAVYAEETQDLNAFIRRNDRFRLLLDLREFDGWQGHGAVSQHFKLAHDHLPLLEKAAIVGDATWQKLAVRAAHDIVGKDVAYFPSEEFDKAVQHLKA